MGVSKNHGTVPPKWMVENFMVPHPMNKWDDLGG